MAIIVEIDTKNEFECVLNEQKVKGKQDFTFFTSVEIFQELMSDFDITQVAQLTVKLDSGVEFSRKATDTHIYANFKEAFMNAVANLGKTSLSERYGDIDSPCFSIQIG